MCNVRRGETRNQLLWITLRSFLSSSAQLWLGGMALLRRSLLNAASRFYHTQSTWAASALSTQSDQLSNAALSLWQQPQSSKPQMTLPFSVRGFATSGEVATTATPPPGVATTNFTWKNVSNQITYSDYNHEPFPVGDPSKRAFTYFVLTGGRFVYAAALRLAVLKFVLSMSASRDVLALASLEVDLGNIDYGQNVTVKWRGKPVFIRRRTESEVAAVDNLDLASLRDPQPDSVRVKNPEWLIVIGVCTHLGCVPLPNAGDYGGYFCPCHGSHYDVSGRIRRGPAPYNLEVPTYDFLEDGGKVLIG